MLPDEKWLLREKYGCEKSAPVFNKSIDETKNKYSWGAGFFADCERLAAGEPLGYVIGWVPFLDCKIWLDGRPLIPRPETEWWTERAIAAIRKAAAALIAKHPPREGSERGPAESSKQPRLFVHILDLCAGSGCIGVAVAKAVPEVRVDFGEIDAYFLPTIEKNLQTNGIDDSRCRVATSDLFQNVPDRYDFILSNPPYIDPILDRTEASVKNFEPHGALYGGRGGVELIERLVAAAAAHLTPHGQLWIEHEPEQVGALASLARHHHFSIATHTDQYAIPRYSILTVAQ